MTTIFLFYSSQIMFPILISGRSLESPSSGAKGNRLHFKSSATFLHLSSLWMSECCRSSQHWGARYWGCYCYQVHLQWKPSRRMVFKSLYWRRKVQGWSLECITCNLQPHLWTSHFTGTLTWAKLNNYKNACCILSGPRLFFPYENTHVRADLLLQTQVGYIR